MAKTETKRPEYRSWLIRNADQMAVNVGASWVILGVITSDVLGKPEVTQFTRVSVLIINAIVLPLFCSTLSIIIMRRSGVRELVIKNIAMIVLFLSMVLGVLAASKLQSPSFFAVVVGSTVGITVGILGAVEFFAKAFR